MKPATFDYLAAGDVGEALEALATWGEEARILAGGQSLMVVLNMRLARPSLLVDINRIAALKRLRAEGNRIEVGAGVTQQNLLVWPELARLSPLLAAALPWVGHLQTRNRGTVCGNIAHADPASELPLCLALLGGEVVLRGREGERTLAARDFQRGVLTTARAPDELVTAVRFPVARAGAGYAFREVGNRHGDFALVAIAVEAADQSLRVGVAGMTDRPAVVEWPRLAGPALDEALNALAWSLRGDDDLHASARYRRELVRRLGRVTIEEAVARCRS